MFQQIATRNKWDRFRYALLLEIALLAMIVPTIAWILDKQLGHTTVLGVGLSGLAMVYTMVYNE